MKNWGKEKDYLTSTRQHMWNDDYFEFLVKCVWKIDKPVKIIDFGCGYGFLAQMLMPLVPEESSYKGIDISEELIKDARKQFANHGDTVSFEVADLNDYIPSADYDIAICQSVLRHLSNPEEILKKMIASVKTGGQVICIEPSRRLENAGLYIENQNFNPFEKDDFLKERWQSELEAGGRDFQIGMKAPVYMEKLGLKNIGVRLNDYVDYVCQEDEKCRFIKDYGTESKYAKADTMLAARCHVISYGYYEGN
ncbi:Methyltransferase domain-containing protein [Pseudobutyrivibrio sp. 49]|uniref:class I SAM-dependent methyltransferase n=1 Tax=Pseudobutyrivibrio sp. 49 TaxID=1855344 RepID=UPI00088A9E2F|nr:class I SAM-dependent methyltransferase [Pseudobutyrivibrio sp. 49]SDI74696.1 Methyltransferase domain-containing protein [Pseudobutyrivibrio sp. 49]